MISHIRHVSYATLCVKRIRHVILESDPMEIQVVHIGKDTRVPRFSSSSSVTLQCFVCLE